MALGYVREKFRVAVLTLADGNEPLRQRLANAWTNALCRLQVEDLPADNRAEFSDMLAKITPAEAMRAEAAFEAGASALTEDDARRMEATIISIYANVCWLHPQS